MIKVSGIIPIHQSYTRPQAMTPSKKDADVEKPKSFQEVLKEKMNQSR